MKLKFYYDPKNDMEMQIIQGVLAQTIMSQMPNVLLSGLQRRARAFLGKDSGNQFTVLSPTLWEDISTSISKKSSFPPPTITQPSGK